ncbi:MAG: hypothetical protein WAM30_05900 [Candidatus Dormiibacterota bacterium]
MEWSVHIDARGPGPYDVDWADEVIDSSVMEGRGPAVSVAAREVGFTFSVEADDVLSAMAAGIAVVHDLDPALQPVDASAEVSSVLERRLAESNVPVLLGVAEVAAALGVSRQRVSELAQAPDFPPALTRLKSGPIWQRSQITRFLDTWERRPGRPSRPRQPRQPV